MRWLLALTLIASLGVMNMSSCGRGRSTPEDEHAHASDEKHGSDADEHASGEDGHDHDDEQEGGVLRLSDAELEEFGVEFSNAAGGVITDSLVLAGEIVQNPDSVAHVVARAGGIAMEIPRTVGDLVEEGEVLAVLESADLAQSKAEYLARAAEAALSATDLERAETIYANTVRLLQLVDENPGVDELREAIRGLDIGARRGEIISAYADLRAAEAIYAREKALFEDRVSSEAEFLQAESELKKALARFQAIRDDLAFANRRERDAARRAKQVADVSLQAAERRLHALGLDEEEVERVAAESDMRLARYEIRSPIHGRLTERHLVRGESLDAGDQAFVISDLSSVWAMLTLYQRDLERVHEGMQVRIVGAHDGHAIDGVIDYVSPILDESTRTTTARVVLENPEGVWKPGMFIRAEVEISLGSGRVVVPSTALMEIEGEPVVFVETDEGIEPRHVRVGRRTPTAVEILDGLAPGERFVASGGLALRAELDKSSLEHAGHAH